jgi:hypothetical protein
MRAVAEGLFLALTAAAPPIGLSFLDIDQDWIGLGDMRRRHGGILVKQTRWKVSMRSLGFATVFSYRQAS